MEMGATVFLYLSLFIVESGLSLGSAGRMQCEFEAGSNRSDGITDHLQPLHRMARCTKLNDQGRGLVHRACSRFLTNRCYIYTTNRTDFDSINRTVDAITSFIESMVDSFEVTDRETEWCGNLLLGIVCNSLYPGCNLKTNTPIGLCRDECLELSTVETCLPVFTRVLIENKEENINLSSYLNCTINNDAHQAGVNGLSDSNVSCYKDLVGVSHSPNPADIEFDWQVNGTEDKANPKETFLLHVLPILGTVVGSTVLIVVVTISWYCLTVLRKKSRCVGVTVERNSSHTDAFPQLTGAEQVYENRYTLVEDKSPQLPGSGIRDIEQTVTVLPAIVTSIATMSSGATSVEENSAMFQLELSDWATVGEGVLIPFDHITITGYLGEGAFGYVVKGLLKDVQADGQEHFVPVAMKTLKNCASYAEMRGLLVESSLMYSFSHAHILSLRGLCLNPQSGAPYLVMPYMEHGDLRNFLRKKADDVTEGCDTLTTYPQGLTHELLTRMCCDVAKGMEYLAEKRLVHRDLAARNCMVDRSLRVRVADFGLTREIYEHDCYRQSTHGQLPIKWMSPESLAYRISNEKTDVWSFGVTCWEVFSLGIVPYLDVDNRDLLDYLEYGRRLTKPCLCNQNVYGIMLLCWDMEPDERPNFSEIVKLLYTDSTAEPTQPAGEHTANSTPSHSAHSELLQIPKVSRGCKLGAHNDGEYVDMACHNHSEREPRATVVENNCTTAPREVSGAPKVTPKYYNVIISDVNGAPIATNTTAATVEETQFNNHEALVLTNSSAAVIQAQNEKESEKLSPAAARLSSASQSGMVHGVLGEKGLLGSIIEHLRDRKTSSEENQGGDIDGQFLAVQMSELESTSDKIAPTTSVMQQSSAESSMPCPRAKSHTLPSRLGSTIQQVSTNMFTTESLESLDSYYDHVDSYQYQEDSFQQERIYDECPTTPNVTIVFETGEKVTPAETIFAFSPKRGSRLHREVKEPCRASKRERGGASRGSVVSMPGVGSQVDGRWRGRMRERFLSFTTGDYVRMHPAAPQLN